MSDREIIHRHDDGSITAGIPVTNSRTGLTGFYQIILRPSDEQAAREREHMFDPAAQARAALRLYARKEYSAWGR
jgi:muramidase (phage lysozyme)